MSFEYSCFLSHRHVQPYGELFSSFYRALYLSISARMEAYLPLPPFWDEKRIAGEYDSEEVISEAVCKSICMVPVYTPGYFHADRPLCSREYFAMVDIEEHRKEVLEDGSILRNQGLIIPIQFRGELPDFVWNQVQSLDFTSFGGTAKRLRNEHDAMHVIETEFAGKIERLCDTVSTLFELFNNDTCPNE
ncbi:MAG: hypothetical protein H8E66_23860 [Planctomycetes bacterium]|nr:hypothetical protein [Planctomycetota bacterium]